MTALAQIAQVTNTPRLRAFRVAGAEAGADLRFGKGAQRDAAKPQRAAPPVPSLSQSGTERDTVWQEPLLQAPFVAQVLGQRRSGERDDVARRSAARAYAGRAIPPALLLDAKV